MCYGCKANPERIRHRFMLIRLKDSIPRPCAANLFGSRVCRVYCHPVYLPTVPAVRSADQLNLALDQESTESTVIPSIYQQSPPCAASLDQESTESTVIPSIYQQSPPCAASLDQESTESTVIPSIYQQSPPCAASLDQESTDSTVIPSIYQQSPPCAASLDQESTESTVIPSIYQQSPPCAASLDQESTESTVIPSIYQQSPPCAASLDQESTESTVIPSIYQQSPPCAASLGQESTESTVIPSIYQQSPPCAASLDQESTESTVIPSIYQQSPPCAASLDQQSPIVIPERHELPHLPPEILKIILQRTLELDCTMIGIFEQVSDHFKELVSHMRPLLHIGDSLAERLGIVACREKCVSVRSIHRAAGRNSGLVQLIRKLLRENIKNWMNAWLMLTAEDYSKYSISHIFRK